jgi:hypothetical protein
MGENAIRLTICPCFQLLWNALNECQYLSFMLLSHDQLQFKMSHDQLQFKMSHDQLQFKMSHDKITIQNVT